MKISFKGALIATTVAAMLVTAMARAADEDSAGEKTVKCAGLKDGKNHEGGNAGNACSGKDACKGKTYEKVSSAKECTDRGGKVLEK